MTDRDEPEQIFTEDIGNKWSTGCIQSNDDFVWIGTTRGLYRVEGTNKVADQILARESILRLEVIEGEVWVGTNFNAYHSL